MNPYRPESQQRSDAFIAALCFVAIAAVVAVMVLTTEPGPGTVKVREHIDKVIHYVNK